MALKAGYYGVKKNVLDNLEQLDGAKIIKSIGAGLNFSDAGQLSCKSATANQAGIAKSTDYIGKDVTITAPLLKTLDSDTGAVSGLSVTYDNEPGDASSTNLISSKGVYDAFKDFIKIETTTDSVTIAAGQNTDITPPAKSGYSVIATDLRLSGAGSTADAALALTGDPNVCRVKNVGAESRTWAYSLRTVYAKTYT